MAQVRFAACFYSLFLFVCCDAQLAASGGGSRCVAWHSNLPIGWTGQALECIIRARGSESRDVRWSGALHHMLSSFQLLTQTSRSAGLKLHHCYQSLNPRRQ